MAEKNISGTMSCLQLFAGHSGLTEFTKTCHRYLDVTATQSMQNILTDAPTTTAQTREYLELMSPYHVKNSGYLERRVVYDSTSAGLIFLYIC